jgi:hemoglobin
MENEITESSIEKLVYRFYDHIRVHKTLGPVFNAAIKAEEWPEHLKTMCSFWSSMMLKTGRYSGNPLQKHLALPRFDESLFDQWLELFAQTSHEIFEEKSAMLFQNASRNVARSFKYMIYGHG